jgi:phage/plasmid-like protein (TIGR03299 family)
MAHGIEKILVGDEEKYSFAFAGKPAWHGLGQRVGDSGDRNIRVSDIERAARADWNVTTDAVMALGSGQIIDGVQALLRDRDRKVLGFTTSKYAIIQHRQLGVLLDELVRARKGTWETCGVLNDGQRVFYSVRLTARLEPLRGDETELFCVATTSHDGTATANLLLTGVRVVCQNTLSLALSQNVDAVAVRHKGRAADSIEKARDVVLAIGDRVDSMGAAMALLTRMKLSEAQSQKFLDLVHPVPSLPSLEVFRGYSDEKRERLLYQQDLAMRVQARIRELHETGEGVNINGVRGTGYGWLNAVTNFATHEMRSKSKIESNLVGEASKLGRRAYAALVEPTLRREVLNAAA